MFSLNQRIGILFRQNPSKKSYQLRYFFLDDQANMYYIASLPKLQKVIRLSKDIKQVKTRLVKTGQKFLPLANYNFVAPRTYATEAVLPFCNRTYVEMKQKEVKDGKNNEKTSFMLLGLMDEDTMFLYDEILYLTGRKKKQIPKRKSLNQQQKDQNQIKAQSKVFTSFIEFSDSFSMEKDLQTDNQYEGQQFQGKAQGRGKQILISKGITFNGIFRQGKKHGSGYLVNENLDTMECQFICDELAGI